MGKTFCVTSKRASNNLVHSLRITLFLTIAVFASSACANSAGCAPASLVSKALAKTKEIVSKELSPVEAEILLHLLKRRTIIVDGEVCFLEKDFAEFGRLVAQFLDFHLSHADRNQLHDDAPSFAQAAETIDDSTRKCLCLRCPSRMRSWCSLSRSHPECCPHICTEIFSTISVGALTGLRGSGVDACCEDSAKRCPLLPSNTKPSKQRHTPPTGSPVPNRLPPSSPTSSTEVPEFQFGESSAKEPSSMSARPSPVMARSSFFRMGLN